MVSAIYRLVFQKLLIVALLEEDPDKREPGNEVIDKLAERAHIEGQHLNEVEEITLGTGVEAYFDREMQFDTYTKNLAESLRKVNGKTHVEAIISELKQAGLTRKEIYVISSIFRLSLKHDLLENDNIQTIRAYLLGINSEKIRALLE